MPLLKSGFCLYERLFVGPISLLANNKSGCIKLEEWELSHISHSPSVTLSFRFPHISNSGHSGAVSAKDWLLFLHDRKDFLPLTHEYWTWRYLDTWGQGSRKVLARWILQAFFLKQLVWRVARADGRPQGWEVPCCPHWSASMRPYRASSNTSTWSVGQDTSRTSSSQITVFSPRLSVDNNLSCLFFLGLSPLSLILHCII